MPQENTSTPHDPLVGTIIDSSKTVEDEVRDLLGISVSSSKHRRSTKRDDTGRDGQRKLRKPTESSQRRPLRVGSEHGRKRLVKSFSKSSSSGEENSPATQNEPATLTSIPDERVNNSRQRKMSNIRRGSWRNPKGGATGLSEFGMTIKERAPASLHITRDSQPGQEIHKKSDSLAQSATGSGPLVDDQPKSRRSGLEAGSRLQSFRRRSSLRKLNSDDSNTRRSSLTRGGSSRRCSLQSADFPRRGSAKIEVSAINEVSEVEELHASASKPPAMPTPQLAIRAKSDAGAAESSSRLADAEDARKLQGPTFERTASMSRITQSWNKTATSVANRAKDRKQQADVLEKNESNASLRSLTLKPPPKDTMKSKEKRRAMTSHERKPRHKPSAPPSEERKRRTVRQRDKLRRSKRDLGSSCSSADFSASLSSISCSTISVLSFEDDAGAPDSGGFANTNCSNQIASGESRGKSPGAKELMNVSSREIAPSVTADSCSEVLQTSIGSFDSRNANYHPIISTQHMTNHLTVALNGAKDLVNSAFKEPKNPGDVVNEESVRFERKETTAEEYSTQQEKEIERGFATEPIIDVLPSHALQSDLPRCSNQNTCRRSSLRKSFHRANSNELLPSANDELLSKCYDQNSDKISPNGATSNEREFNNPTRGLVLTADVSEAETLDNSCSSSLTHEQRSNCDSLVLKDKERSQEDVEVKPMDACPEMSDTLIRRSVPSPAEERIAGCVCTSELAPQTATRTSPGENERKNAWVPRASPTISPLPVSLKAESPLCREEDIEDSRWDVVPRVPFPSTVHPRSELEPISPITFSLPISSPTGAEGQPSNLVFDRWEAETPVKNHCSLGAEEADRLAICLDERNDEDSPDYLQRDTKPAADRWAPEIRTQEKNTRRKSLGSTFINSGSNLGSHVNTEKLPLLKQRRSLGHVGGDHMPHALFTKEELEKLELTGDFDFVYNKENRRDGDLKSPESQTDGFETRFACTDTKSSSSGSELSVAAHVDETNKHQKMEARRIAILEGIQNYQDAIKELERELEQLEEALESL